MCFLLAEVKSFDADRYLRSLSSLVTAINFALVRGKAGVGESETHVFQRDRCPSADAAGRMSSGSRATKSTRRPAALGLAAPGRSLAKCMRRTPHFLSETRPEDEGGAGNRTEGRATGGAARTRSGAGIPRLKPRLQKTSFNNSISKVIRRLGQDPVAANQPLSQLDQELVAVSAGSDRSSMFHISLSQIWIRNVGLVYCLRSVPGSGPLSLADQVLKIVNLSMPT